MDPQVVAWSVGEVEWHARIHEGRGLPLIAWHGFGQDASWFDPIAAALAPRWRLAAADLPAHGRIHWPEGRPCTVGDLLAFADGILERTGASRYGLLGFSMGARYAGALAAADSPRIVELHLASPEGLRPNPGLGLARRAWGRGLLNLHVASPGFLIGPVRFGRQLGLVRPRIADFLLHHLSHEPLRRLTRASWLAMRNLPRADRRWARSVDAARLPVHVWVGRRDPLIRRKDAETLAGRIRSAELHVLDRGHFLVDEDWAARMQTDERGPE